jgi:hypothetical protein
MEQMLEQR